ncbi:hypothetical protein PGTUg99_018496 [Puccinia graminis f. sp. tritici]|uniref:Uncharacterized protein n=1 Tax=Puccinia graminis f. sp. tritici TaxID=56615 RepID=A0A5B0M275_PUCGR|nr:hypothetical protein PGTUg99_018496 [Puccinia graminis f. sp. tritici]
MASSIFVHSRLFTIPSTSRQSSSIFLFPQPRYLSASLDNPTGSELALADESWIGSPSQGGQWGPPGNTRLRRNFLPFQPPVYKGRLDLSSSTSSPVLHSTATSIPSSSETIFKKPLFSTYFHTMVTTRSSKARAVSETPALLPPVTHGAPVARSGFQAIRSASTVSPTELHANKFMISGPARPFTPVNSPNEKIPIPVHPSTVAPTSSRAGQHVDPHLVQEGINFYPIQGRWSPAFTPSTGNFPPGLRSPDFIDTGSTDGSSATESSRTSVSDGFSSGSDSHSSAPTSGPPSIPNSSAFPSPSSSDLRSVPPSEIFYANRPRPTQPATGSGNSYDDPMVVDDDSSADSRPDSVPFGPTTEWGSTQQARPPANPVDPDPSAREMMEFDYNTIRNRLVGSNPYPFGTKVYREEDLLFMFQHVANDFIHLTNKYPASTLGEIEDRVQFYQNLQWVFTADRQVFLATHCGYP